MLTYLAIARRYQPRWLVWENVPGVLSSNGGRDFGTFIRGLEECGYHAAWRVLDAQYFGLAQRRRRVFVVGYLGDWRRAASSLFEHESLGGHSSPVQERVFNCFDTGVTSLDRSSKDNILWDDGNFRFVSPTELERAFGFPDGYTNIPVGKKMAADGPRYKALGNSMAINCMRWIGRRIELVEASHDPH